MKIITNSRLAAYRRCPRFEQIQYGLGYRPVVEDENQFFGRLLHIGLEAWWKTKNIQIALEAIRKEPANPFDTVKAEVLLEGYDARWLNEPYETLGVEVPFEMELKHPATGLVSKTARRAGKIDVIIRDMRDSKILICEHKGSSSDITPGSDYWKRLRLDGQVSMYYEGAKSLGYDISGCLYDVIGKPGQRPLKANAKRKTDETPEEYRKRIIEAMLEYPEAYYRRGTIVRLESEMLEANLDVWNWAHQMDGGFGAPKNPDACFSYGRMCSYFSVCCGESSLDNQEHFKKSDNIHPELI